MVEIMSRYIEEEEVIKQIHDDYKKLDVPEEWSKGINFAIGRILKQPTADVRENVHGEWQVYYDEDSPQDGVWTCPVCSYTRSIDDISPTNFCPYCGADMKGSKNAEIH